MTNGCLYLRIQHEAFVVVGRRLVNISPMFKHSPSASADDTVKSCPMKTASDWNSKHGRTHLLCSLDQSAPLQLGNHPADELRVELHLIHLHLSCLRTKTTRQKKTTCQHQTCSVLKQQLVLRHVCKQMRSKKTSTSTILSVCAAAGKKLSHRHTCNQNPIWLQILQILQIFPFELNI